MANHISMKRLGDIVNFKRGYDLPSYNRKDGNYPIVSSSGISGYHAEYKVDGEGVVIGRYGTLGEVYYVNGKYWPHNTALYVTDFKGNYPKYVYYLLKVLGNLQTSDKSTVPGINRNDLHEVIIPCADSKDQQKIAAVLSALDAKIELNARINTELEQVAKTLYDYWFVQFEFPTTLSAPLSFGHPPKYDMETLGNTESQSVVFGGTEGGYKSAGGKMVWNEALKREIPLGWEVGTLGDILSLEYGKPLKEEERSGSGYPVVGSNGIVGYHKDYLVEGSGIVVGRKGTAGAVVWVEDNFFPIDTTFFVKDKLGMSELFFHYQLLKRTNFKKLESSSAVPGLNRNFAYSIKVAIPEIKLIQEFNKIISPIFSKIKACNKESQTLTELRDWLLPMLMNGQVTIK